MKAFSTGLHLSHPLKRTGNLRVFGQNHLPPSQAENISSETAQGLYCSFHVNKVPQLLTRFIVTQNEAGKGSLLKSVKQAPEEPSSPSPEAIQALPAPTQTQTLRIFSGCTLPVPKKEISKAVARCHGHQLVKPALVLPSEASGIGAQGAQSHLLHQKCPKLRGMGTALPGKNQSNEESGSFCSLRGIRAEKGLLNRAVPAHAEVPD